MELSGLRASVLERFRNLKRYQRRDVEYAKVRRGNKVLWFLKPRKKIKPCRSEDLQCILKESASSGFEFKSEF